MNWLTFCNICKCPLRWKMLVGVSLKSVVHKWTIQFTDVSIHHQVSMSLVCIKDINDLVQDCSNSIALAMELLQSCTKPSIRNSLHILSGVSFLLALPITTHKDLDLVTFRTWAITMQVISVNCFNWCVESQQGYFVSLYSRYSRQICT